MLAEGCKGTFIPMRGMVQTMRPKMILLSVVVLFAFSMAATPSGLAASHEDVVEIRIVETGDDSEPYAFEDAEVMIEPGTTVRWVHTHDVSHTVTSTNSHEDRQPNGMFDGSLSSEGDTFEYTFDEPGMYHYFCQPHSGFMFGTVHVEGEGTDEQGNDAPFPAALLSLVFIAAAGLRRRA